MAINVSQSFHRTSANAVDDTMTLTKAEMLAVNDNMMPTYYFTICQDDGKLYLYNKNATPSSSTGKFEEYTSSGGDAGIYSTSSTLTTVIGGTAIVNISSIAGLTADKIVIGQTLVYDGAGSLGRITAATSTQATITTVTASPGERRGVRLGAVNNKSNLPATSAAATTLGWQTPIEGDYAYVRTDETHSNNLTEWVITAIDAYNNITWGYSHTLNAGDYVVDIYKSDGTIIPKAMDGTVTLPEFGTIKGIKDASGTSLVPSAQGIVTLPADQNTKYTYVNTYDGFRITDNDTGNTFIHQDLGVTLAEDEHLRSSGRNLFVDGDNGDDTGLGTLESPFKTIQRAINELRPIGYRLSDADRPGYGRFDTIYVNCGASDPYQPVFFEKVQPVTIYSYDPVQSYIDASTGGTVIYNDSLTATLRITAERYPRTDSLGYVYPNAWYQRESIVYLRVKSLVINQNCASTGMLVCCSSYFEMGEGWAASSDNIAYTITINATKTEAQTFAKLNPSTGKWEAFTTPTVIGCEGLGVHYNSCFYVRGKASVGARVTINASNWAVASSRASWIQFDAGVTLAGGSNIAQGNYGGCYSATQSLVICNASGASTSSPVTQSITSNGKSCAISASDGGVFRTSNAYVKETIQQTRTDCVSPCVNAVNGGLIVISHTGLTSGAYLNIIGKTTTQRTIGGNCWGHIMIGWPNNGTSQASNPTNGTQQCITAAESGRVTMWGGSGTTFPKITGKVGYAAYNGGQLTYANLGSFTGTTQRAAGSGGRIYTGNQSSVGNY